MENTRRGTNKVDFDSKRLKECMALRRINIKTLARETHVDYSALTRRIREGKMSMLELNSICAIIGCDLEYILDHADLDFGYNQVNKPTAYETPEEFIQAYYGKPENVTGLEMKQAGGASGLMASLRSPDWQPVEKILDFIVRICGQAPLLDAIERNKKKAGVTLDKSEIEPESK